MKYNLLPDLLRRFLRDYSHVPKSLVLFYSLALLVPVGKCIQVNQASSSPSSPELPTARIALVNLETGPIRTITDKVNQEVVLTVPIVRLGEAYLFECNASYPVEWNYIGEGNPTATADVGRHFRDFYDVNSYTYQSILQMQRLEELQTGRYICRGSNAEQEKSQVHYDLFVPGNRSRILLSTTEKEIFASESKPLITLPCSITDPSQVINLYKGNSWGTFQMIETNQSIQFRPRKGFILKLGELSDPFGTYMCTTQDNKIRRTLHLIPERLKAKHDILNSNHLHGKVQVDISYDFEYNRILCCTGGSPYIPKLQWAGCGSVLDCKIKSVCFEEDRCEPRLGGESGSVTHWLDPGPLPRGCAGWKLRNEPNGDYGIFKCSTPGVSQYQPYILNRGNIFLEFDKAPASETILSLTKTTDEPVVVGGEVEYHCNSTRFYFAYGIRWAFQRGNGDIEFVDDSSVIKDRFPNTDHRRQTTFRITHEDIKGIICFVPIANSPTEWRTVSLPINVKGGYSHLSKLNDIPNPHQYTHQQVNYISNNALPLGPSPSPFQEPYSTSRPQGYYNYHTQQDSNSVPKIDIAEISQPEIVFKPSAPVLPTFQPHPLLAQMQHPTALPLPTYQPHPLLAQDQKSPTAAPLPSYQPHPLLAQEQHQQQHSLKEASYDSPIYSQIRPTPTTSTSGQILYNSTAQFLREREQQHHHQPLLHPAYNSNNGNANKRPSDDGFVYEPFASSGGNQLGPDQSSSSLVYKSNAAPHHRTPTQGESQQDNVDFGERNYDTSSSYINSYLKARPNSGEIQYKNKNKHDNYHRPRVEPTASADVSNTKTKPYFTSYESSSDLEAKIQHELGPSSRPTALVENFHLRDIPSPIPQPRIHCDSQGKRCSLRTSHISSSSSSSSREPTSSNNPDIILGTRASQSQQSQHDYPLSNLDLPSSSKQNSNFNRQQQHSSSLLPDPGVYSTLTANDYYTASLRAAQDRRRSRVKSKTSPTLASPTRRTTTPITTTTTDAPYYYTDDLRQPAYSSHSQESHVPSWETGSSLQYSSNRRSDYDPTPSQSRHRTHSSQSHHRIGNSRKHHQSYSSNSGGDQEGSNSDENYYYQRYAPHQDESSNEPPAVQFHINLPSDPPSVVPTGRRLSSSSRAKSKSSSSGTMQKLSSLNFRDYSEPVVGTEDDSGDEMMRRTGYIYGEEDVPLIELG